jgi:hypothetical protein
MIFRYSSSCCIQVCVFSISGSPRAAVGRKIYGSQGVFSRGARGHSLTNGKEWVTYVHVQVYTASCHVWQGINYLIINHIGILWQKTTTSC